MGYVKGVKWDYKLVIEYLNKYNFTLINKEFKNVNNYLEIVDKDEYKYRITFAKFLKNNKPNKFDKRNIFTIDNCKLWIKNNKPQFELISNKWIGNSEPLVFKDVTGFYYFTSWQSFTNNLTTEIFRKTNPYILDNIKLWLKIYYPKFTLLSDKYYGSDTYLTLIDKDGFLYYVCWESIQQLRNFDKYNKSNPYTIQNIKLWCKLNNKPFELVSDIYDGNNKKLKWKCHKEDCNEIFEMNWSNISQGKNCPYCTGQKVGLSNCLATKNPELASEWHPTLNGDLTPYDVTCGSGKYVWWQCKENPKHIWYAQIKSKNNNSCSYCSGRIPSEEHNLLISNPELCEEWNYEKNSKKPEEYTPYSDYNANWICKKCGYQWNAPIYRRNSGIYSGCSQCNNSKNEDKISNYLIKNGYIKINQNDLVSININNYFIPQYIFPNCRYIQPLRFDFYIPNYNILIEYQGEQHYFPIDFAGKGKEWSEEQFQLNQKRDQIKRDYCNDNNIKLLEIPYWDFDNIEQILQKELSLLPIEEVIV